MNVAHILQYELAQFNPMSKYNYSINESQMLSHQYGNTKSFLHILKKDGRTRILGEYDYRKQTVGSTPQNSHQILSSNGKSVIIQI